MKSPLTNKYVCIGTVGLMLILVGCGSGELQSELAQVHLFYDSTVINYDEKRTAEAHILFGDVEHIDVARLKLRGGWSRKYPKKSYTINWQSDPKLSFLLPDNDYILNASYVDKTMMRHAFSYETFQRLNETKTVAPTSQFVEVFVNHNYEGLYLLHPRVDRSYLGLSSSGSLFKDPPVFMVPEIFQFAEEDNPYHQKYPDLDRRDDNIVLADWRSRYLDTVLCESDIFENLDRDVVLNWHLMLLVTHGSDGLLKNFYLYRQDTTSLWRICIWDYDHSFGRDGDNELNTDTTLLDLSRNWLLSNLLECPDYREDLSRRYRSARSTVFHPDSMIHRLDASYQKYRPFIMKNGERWPWNSTNYFDDNTADQEVSLMKDFIRYKIDQLDLYFDSL